MVGGWGFRKEPNLVVVALLLKTIATCLSSLICVVLNSLLVVFLLTTNDFRNLKFSPVVIQAVIDILGPGVANFGYEILLYQQSQFNDLKKDLSRYLARETRISVETTASCVFTFFRVILNENTTGVCVTGTSTKHVK